MRLNRYLAHCGLASRRSAEKLILAGQVRVNGAVTLDLATQIREGEDRVEVADAEAHPPSRLHYLMLNKPEGYDVTRRDPHAPKTVFELLPPETPYSVQPVGRLDRATTGLLLLTSDGELSHRLAHPRRRIEKEYEALGPRAPTQGQMDALLGGVDLEDGRASALRVEKIEAGDGKGGSAERPLPVGLRIVTHLGRKRIVRRMCRAVGFELVTLRRVRVGPLLLGNLGLGHWRALTDDELLGLRRAAGLGASNSEPSTE